MKKAKLFTLALIGTSIFALASCAETSSNSSASQGQFDTSKKIKLYTRDTDSGTRDGFFTGIGLEDAKADNAPLSKDISTATNNGNMISVVKNDEYGIGYISLSTLKDSGLVGLSYEGVEPTEENVLNNTYSLTRNFNYIIRDSYSSQDKKDIVEAFIAYMGTQEGKLTMKAEGGIVSISNDDPTWDEIKANYPITQQDNSDITMYFGGSTSVSETAKALADEFTTLCGNVKFNHNYLGSGDAYTKTQGENKDVEGAFDMAFASREFKLTSSEPAKEGTYGKMCVDAIVAVVNSANTYRATDAETLVKMYTGKVSTWAEVIA